MVAVIAGVVSLVPPKPSPTEVASISIMVAGKNWDADPEDDGIGILVVPEDNMGKSVYVAGKVSIELYEQYVAENLEIVKGNLVYEGDFEVSADRVKRMALFTDEIRIPFEDMASSPYNWGTIFVSFTTDGRTFTAKDEIGIRIKP